MRDRPSKCRVCRKNRTTGGSSAFCSLPSDKDCRGLCLVNLAAMYSNLRPAPYSRACRAAPLLDATHPRRQRAQRLHATAPAGASDATTSCSDAESLPLVAAARRLYEEAWSQGNIRALNAIMAEDHAQCDVIWQPQPGIGRDRMKRGILAYRKAYPDVKFTVLSAAPAPGHRVFVHWCVPRQLFLNQVTLCYN